jgi:hypothetical protein
MKESYGEVLASHSGLEPYADDGNVVGVRACISLRSGVVQVAWDPVPCVSITHSAWEAMLLRR